MRIRLRSGGGTIRLREELAHGANKGLGAAQAWLAPVRARHPGVSHGDLFTLAGAVAIERMGGPHIPWRSGRVDESDDVAKVTPDGRLPDADKGRPEATAAGLRATFGRMGARVRACFPV
jgi:cytochrome c peroxidase